MSDKTVILITWEDSSKAYEAFSRFRTLASPALTVTASAVVERDDNGQLKVTDENANDLGLGTFGGGSLGALLGIIGGPLGVLLGFAGGALIGSTIDVSKDMAGDDILTTFSRSLPPGRTGIVAEVEETDPSRLDDFVAESGGELKRRSEEELLGEIAVAEEAAEAASRAAREQSRSARKTLRKEERAERIQKIKAKL
ncbi:DUF1269 domain-containing protein [Brevibacterium aurantiacum]|uniref:DUF1269 domain-containing protein n=1 Tax=Brevibacterium aurantiacum TaxID=273384 RepID=A0A3T0DAH1_BREAU|nr:DUF1269 domain-containing protein [Brevibacterium aurantiacum]AZT92083.1 DUF1269 domain-containing protein [Brevibacterium aurantiacum]